MGAKTGRLLPTGRAVDEVAGYAVSCVDVAVPMVIACAADFGKTAHEKIEALEADRDFMAALRAVWVEAGLRMGLKGAGGRPMTADELAQSETIPKVCIVGAPQGAGHIAVRYFTPQAGHRSMAVSGGCCLAAAALIPGSVAHGIARGLPAAGAAFGEIDVGIENPAGVLEATIEARQAASGLEVRKAAYRRSTQILLRGHVPLYRASDALRGALSWRVVPVDRALADRTADSAPASGPRQAPRADLAGSQSWLLSETPARHSLRDVSVHALTECLGSTSTKMPSVRTLVSTSSCSKMRARRHSRCTQRAR